MSKQSSSGGVGFLGLLTLIFIGLKLAEVGIVAGWSWWAVLSPMWIPALAGIVLFTLIMLVYAARKVWRR